MQIRAEKLTWRSGSTSVTLSLNAEMEREKKLQEEAMEKLAEVLEGEDLDAIEAAIEEAVAKGVAEEALAKARATHKKLERKQRAAGFSRGSRASRASRASRDSLPDEERSVKSDVLSVHADDAAALSAGAGGAGADRGRGGPALVGGRSDGTGRSAAQDVAGPPRLESRSAGGSGSARRRRPCRRRAPPSLQKRRAPLPMERRAGPPRRRPRRPPREIAASARGR